MEYDRDHTQVKPQVKPVLDREVLIRDAGLVSETTFIYNSLRSFCDFHEKCFVRHVRSGISLCQAQDQLWVDAKHQMCTCGPWKLCFTYRDRLERGAGNEGETFAEQFLASAWCYFVPGSKDELAEWSAPNRAKVVLGTRRASPLTAWQHTPASFMPGQGRWLPLLLPASCLQCCPTAKSGLGLWSVLRPELQERL